jgi:hypothetical protein
MASSFNLIGEGEFRIDTPWFAIRKLYRLETGNVEYSLEIGKQADRERNQRYFTTRLKLVIGECRPKFSISEINLWMDEPSESQCPMKEEGCRLNYIELEQVGLNHSENGVFVNGLPIHAYNNKPKS